MNKKIKLTLRMLTLAIGLFAGSQYARAAVITVSNDTSVCPARNYTTIQAAVNAANAGDTINICPGIYPEQVTVEKSLTVRGIQVGSNKLVVVRPNGMVVNDGNPGESEGINRERAVIILVRRAANQVAIPNVTIQNLVVDGINNGLSGCTPDFIGIFYRNAGGSIIQNSVKNIRLGDAQFGCQTGLGIYAFPDGNEAGYNLFIQENVVDNFQKNGITVYGADLNGEPDAYIGAYIFRNTVNGAGPTAVIAQNGIQLSDGIKNGSVVNFNAVSNIIYTGDPTTGATGILLFDILTGIDIQANNVNRTDNAFGIYGVSNSTIRFNDISNSVKFEGIYISGDGGYVSNGNSLTTNRVFNSKTTGISLEGDGNTLSGNRINDADVGIATGGDGNTIASSVFNNVRMTQATIVNDTAPAFQTARSGRGEERTIKKGAAVVRQRPSSFVRPQR